MEELKMNNLQAGFARVNVTPMMGIGINGYFKDRIADGVLDELEINAIALRTGDDTVVLAAIDSCSIASYILDEFRASVSAATGLSKEAIYIHTTHLTPIPKIRECPREPRVLLLNIRSFYFTE